MKRSQTLVPSAVIVALLSLLVPGFADAEIISAGVSFTSTNGNGHADSMSRMIGWQFTVGANPIVVTELGYQDFGIDGLLTSHQVGIWQLSNQLLIDSAVVPGGKSGTLDGFFRYAPLASPTALASGTTYVIAGFDNGADRHVWDVALIAYPNMQVNGFSVDPAITLGAAGTARGPAMTSFGFPTGTVPDARACLMGPNLKYSVVPEPSTFIISIGLGLIGLAGYGWRRKRKLA
jgi:LPXTG-motif cell wall-anchored protein